MVTGRGRGASPTRRRGPPSRAATTLRWRRPTSPKRWPPSARATAPPTNTLRQGLRGGRTGRGRRPAAADPLQRRFPPGRGGAPARGGRRPHRGDPPR
ncbi:hypothetical protein C1I97_21645 [Streptomyces sp. NTH33]|nr:hypothetical protein C1I97_21645 [Streptomyces sp. NTH33]